VKLLAELERQNKPSKLLLGLALIGAIGFADLLTGYELAFSVFYVIPIALSTWLMGRRFGIMASIASALVWLVADVASGHPYSQPLIPIWNTLIRFSLFLIITVLMSTLKRTTEHERELARTDSLTGALNSRYFVELVGSEINRLARFGHPFTLAYLDLDNFKSVNDRFGHAAGDQALCTLVSHARSHLRKTDVIARLGGDEFVFLLVGTGQQPARAVLSKLQTSVQAEMQKNGWPITLSAGVLTCQAAPRTVDELVTLADDLMYAAKREGKNALKYMTYPA